MMEKESENKKLLRLLLEAYSVEEIKEIFNRIDDRIIDLMEFSSKDFIEINKILKSSYNDIKSLETNSNEIFNLKIYELAQKAVGDLKRTNATFVSLENIYKQLIHQINKLKNNIEHTEPLFHISVKNLKQNITSLKLWLTNNAMEFEKIELNTTGNTLTDRLNLYLLDTLNFLEETKNSYHITDQNLDSILDIVSVDMNYHIENNIDPNVCEAPEEYVNLVKRLLEENNEAVSNIITKLQYHDIVRQKVEHIQEIHNEILQELNLLKTNPDNANIHQKVKYFFQIRDISGLQAAQLFHVNNDYQKAIKTITSSLLNISENMGKISNGCSEYAKTSETCPKELSQIYQTYSRIVDSWQQIDLTAIVDLLKNSQKTVRQINEMLEQIAQFKTRLPDFANDQLNPGTLKQAKEIIHSIETNISDCLGFSDEYNKFGEYLENILASITEFDKQRNAIVLNKPLSNQLHVNASEISTKLNNIKGSTKELSKTLNKVVDNIAYYEYFDQVIEQVIDELNTINLTLLDDDIALDSDNKKKNLDFIKQKYTMQSEYSVHENALNSKTLSAESEDDDIDDNDVEFF